MDDKNLIKVHRTITDGGPVSGEWVWAHDLGERKARVNSIPFVCDLNRNDVIEFNEENKEVTDVIEIGSHTTIGFFPFDEDENISNLRWEKIRNHFKEYDIDVEGAGNGLFVMAVPLKMPYHKFRKIARSCPVKINLGPDNKTNDRDRE